MSQPDAASGAKLRVAILSFAHTHAASYARHLVGLADVELLSSDPGGHLAPDAGPRGAELAQQLGIAYVPSYAEVFAWNPDAVIVTSENAGHRALVEAAAAAGAHVLCEKPLATSVADAQAMNAACDAAGVILMTAFPVRFAPSFRDVQARVQAGELGTMLGIRGTNNGKIPLANRAWFTDETLAGGGALVDHVVHCADLLDSLLGSRASVVRAVSNKVLHADKGISVETGGLVTLTYPNGVIASIDCSWSVPSAAPTWGGLTLEIVGTRGTMAIDPFAQRVSGYDADGPIWESIGDDLDGAMISEFLSAIRTGRTPQPDGKVGLRTQEIVAAARESSLTGQPVSL